MKYNLAAHNSNTRNVARFIERHYSGETAEEFISVASRVSSFPYLSVRELSAAGRKSGANLIPMHATVEELASLHVPAMAFVDMMPDLPYSLGAIELISAQNGELTIPDAFNRPHTIKIDEMNCMFSGIVLLAGDRLSNDDNPLAMIEPFVFHSGILSHEECDTLVELFESRGFSDIPVSDQPASCAAGPQIRSYDLGARMNIGDVQGEIVDRLKYILTRLAGPGVTYERSECIKMSTHSKAFRRFDSGVNLRRRKAIHLAIGHQGHGILVDFTECPTERALAVGAAILIESCDGDGRTNWRSEWSIRPPQSGDLYLVSCWFN